MDQTTQEQLPEELSQRVFDEVQRGCLPDTTVDMVDFVDANPGIKDNSRRYVIVSTETPRGSRLRVYATFQRYGDQLFVGVRSFLLPAPNWLFVLAFLLPPALILVLGTLGAIATEQPLLIPLSLAVAGIAASALFLPTIRTLSTGEGLGCGLRNQFPSRRRRPPFDEDDTLKFFKSSLPLVLRSVQAEFEKRGIPVDVLERAIQVINNITSTSYSSVNTQGGAFHAIGSVIGGHGNQAQGAVL